MVGALVERDDAATAYCGITLHRDDDRALEQRHFRYDRDQLLIRNQIDLNAFDHRRRVYDQLGGFDERLTRLVDWDLILRRTRLYPPVEVPQFLVDYDAGDGADRVTNAADFESNASDRPRALRPRAGYLGTRAVADRLRALGLPGALRRPSSRTRFASWRRAATTSTSITTPTRIARRGRLRRPDLQGRGLGRARAPIARHGRTILHSHFAYPAVTCSPGPRPARPACRSRSWSTRSTSSTAPTWSGTGSPRSRPTSSACGCSATASSTAPT